MTRTAGGKPRDLSARTNTLQDVAWIPEKKAHPREGGSVGGNGGWKGGGGRGRRGGRLGIQSKERGREGG